MTLTWQECAARGMSVTEAAKARGMTPGAASKAAKRGGFSFRNATKSPEFTQIMSDVMIARHQCADYARGNADRCRKNNPNPWVLKLATMTPSERADYNVLRAARYSAPEAWDIVMGEVAP